MSVAMTLAIIATALVGCNANLKHAACGWSTNIPSDGNYACSETYRVLNKIAQAEIHNKPAVVHRYVTASNVERRVLAFGVKLRRHSVRFLRVTPSIELSQEPHHRVSVQAYIVGKWSKGKIDDAEGVTERIVGKKLTVIGDLPKQQW